MFSPKDQIILTASKDTLAILWNFNSGEQMFKLQGHALSVNCAVMSDDGNFSFTGSSDLTCRIWNNSNGTCTGILQSSRRITSI